MRLGRQAPKRCRRCRPPRPPTCSGAGFYPACRPAPADALRHAGEGGMSFWFPEDAAVVDASVVGGVGVPAASAVVVPLCRWMVGALSAQAEPVSLPQPCRRPAPPSTGAASKEGTALASSSYGPSARPVVGARALAAACRAAQLQRRLCRGGRRPLAPLQPERPPHCGARTPAAACCATRLRRRLRAGERRPPAPAVSESARPVGCARPSLLLLCPTVLVGGRRRTVRLPHA
jgi:hypothetical protein